MSNKRLIFITILSLLAFAANSVITRLALIQTDIDAASFVMLRIISGAGILWLFLVLKNKNKNKVLAQGNWPSALALFAYATSFTYGYGMIAAGSGALLLFGAVQITMIIIGFKEGESLVPIQVSGFLLAMAGLTLLMLPGIEAPPLFGTVLMCISGISWGIYSLQGRGSFDPTGATAGNFIRATPLALTLWIIALPSHQYDLMGTSYALLSGIVTSGLGYIIWYTAVSDLKASQAAIVQLIVPVIVALGGGVLLDEPITQRLVIASMMTLGGTILVLKFKRTIVTD
jgi:drug/metabolite transporter (DMT)-like permease